MDYLNSPLFGGIVAGLATIATGWFAIKVFKLQKETEKVNAAVSVLFEIRNAESKVDIISEKLISGNANDLPNVLPTNSWKKHSHLFAKDFDEDEFKTMNTFYNSCELIEDLVNRQNNFFWIATEERGKVAQNLLGQIHLEHARDAIGDEAKQTAAKEKFNKLREALTKFYTGEEYFYTPSKTANGLKFSIDHLQKLTSTTCGAKLKNLAKV